MRWYLAILLIVLFTALPVNAVLVQVNDVPAIITDLTVTETSTFTPSAAQAITAVGDTILANATIVVVDPDADYELTSTPTIADGATGQVLYITAANAEANVVTLQDQDILAGTNLQLLSSTRRITGADSVSLYFDGTDWIELGALGHSVTFIVAASDSLYGQDANYVCDGTADDVEIQAAINALPANGGEIRLLEGTYTIVDSIAPVSGLRLTGDGEGSIIDGSGLGAGEAVIEYDAASLADLQLDHFSILGPATDYNPGAPPAEATGTGIYIQTNTLNERFVAQNLHISQCQFGIWLQDTNASLQFFKVQDNVLEENSRAGVFISGGNRGAVSGNSVDGLRVGVGDAVMGDAGIWITEAAGTYITELISVNANSVSNCDTESINISARNISVIGNVIESNGQTGISLETAGAVPVAGAGSGNTIAANHIANATLYGIHIRHDPGNNTVAGKYNTVVGNTITGTGSVGILVGLAGAVELPYNNTITANVIYDVTGSGIVVDDSIGTVLSANEILGTTGSGITVSGVSDLTSIEGGVIENAGLDAIVVSETSDNTTITDVLITNPDRYGIRPSGTPDHIIVQDCTFVDNQGAPTMDMAIAAAAGTLALTVRDNTSWNHTGGGGSYVTDSAASLIRSGNLEDGVNVDGMWRFEARDNSSISTVGAGEDDLRSITLDLNLLGATSGLRILAAGTKAGANNTKEIKFYLGVTFITVHAAANDINDWRVEIELFNTAAGAQRLSWVGFNGATVLQGYDTMAEDTTGDLTLKFTGECINAADTITQTMFLVQTIR